MNMKAALITPGTVIIEGGKHHTVTKRHERACTPMHIHVTVSGQNWCYHHTAEVVTP